MNVSEILSTATKLRHFAFGHRDFVSINIWDALHSAVVALHFAELCGYQKMYDIIIIHQFDIVDHILYGDARRLNDSEMNDTHVDRSRRVVRVTQPLSDVKQKRYILKLDLILRGSLISFIKAQFTSGLRADLENQDTISLLKTIYIHTGVTSHFD